MFTDVPEVFVTGAELHTAAGDVLTVSASRPHQGHLIVAFAEVADRSAAEALRNLALSAATRPDLHDNEFWVSELLGKEVRDTAGSHLGIVADVDTTTAQDRLVVDTGHGPVEVPFVSDLVPEVGETHVVVDPPPGLFG